MNVIVFEGRLGAGKTLGATLFAKYYQQRSNCALYTNYGVQGSKHFSSLDDFFQIAQEDSSILIIDEAHIDLDSRSFSSNHVKFFSQVSYYLRKLRCTMIITSPMFEDLDSRIRGVTNMLVQIDSLRDRFVYHCYDPSSGHHFQSLQIMKTDAFMLAPHLFDTYSMVTPIDVPDNRQGFKDYLESLNDFHTNYHKEKRIDQYVKAN